MFDFVVDVGEFDFVGFEDCWYDVGGVVVLMVYFFVGVDFGGLVDYEWIVYVVLVGVVFEYFVWSGEGGGLFGWVVVVGVG